MLISAPKVVCSMDANCSHPLHNLPPSVEICRAQMIFFRALQGVEKIITVVSQSFIDFLSSLLNKGRGGDGVLALSVFVVIHC